MAIRIRRGNLIDFDKDKLVQGELAIVLDAGELHFCYGPGNTKRLQTREDLQQMLDMSDTSFSALIQLIADLENDPNELTNILSNISALQNDKADKSYVDNSLELKVDKTSITNQIINDQNKINSAAVIFGLSNQVDTINDNIANHRDIYVSTSEPESSIGEDGSIYLQLYEEGEAQLTYEEGNWTPNLTFAGDSEGLVYHSRAGKYVKIGNRVFCDLDIRITDKGTSVGRIEIQGLPFTQSGTNSRFTFGDMRFVDFPTDAKTLVGLVTGNIIVAKFVMSGAVELDANNTHLLTPSQVRLGATFSYSI